LPPPVVKRGMSAVEKNIEIEMNLPFEP